MDSYDILANQPVVIDNGSGHIKAGFAGDQQPKCHFASFTGRPKHVRVMAGALEGDIFIGPRAEEHRGLLHVKYPMEHGMVTDWNDMERIWQYIYSKDQLSTFAEEHPVLLTEAPLNPRRNREKAAEVFFETFSVPALYVSMQAILSLYATGRTTGVVMDSGDGVSHAVPIYEGFALPHSIMRSDVAGRDVTRYLKLLLRKVLFRPELMGLEFEGLHEILTTAIKKSDMDLRRILYSNIVLSGGSTLFKGFGDRLLADVKKLSPKDTKIRISAPKERLFSTWIGGSILASLDTFKKMWVSRKEYDDEGARVIHKKTF